MITNNVVIHITNAAGPSLDVTGVNLTPAYVQSYLLPLARRQVRASLNQNFDIDNLRLNVALLSQLLAYGVLTAEEIAADKNRVSDEVLESSLRTFKHLNREILPGLAEKSRRLTEILRDVRNNRSGQICVPTGYDWSELFQNHV